MKKVISLLFFIPVFCSAQQWKLFDTTFTNSISDSFFNKNVVSEIVFSYIADSFYSATVRLHPEDSIRRFDEHYDFKFIGDKYFFDKKYSMPQMPVVEMRRATGRRTKNDYLLNIRLTPDTIQLKCWYDYQDISAVEAPFFTKVPQLCRYQYGLNDLEERINNEISNENHNLKFSKDSAYLFTMIVDNKDSCLHSVELAAGNKSRLTDLIITTLKSSCGWQPSFEGGRPVKAYRKLFLTLDEKSKVSLVTNVNCF